MFGIKKLLRQILARLEKMETALDSRDQANTRDAQQLAAGIKELQSAVNTHDMAIEDLLDSWEEMQQEQREETRKLASALAASTEREREQYAVREKALLDLAITACDQLYGLRRAAEETNDEAWRRQLDLAWRKLNEVRLPAGFAVVCETGIPVNYALHEVIGVTEAASPERNHLVAEVYSCGYVHMGKVLRKAKISAFHTERENAEEMPTEKGQEYPGHDVPEQEEQV